MTHSTRYATLRSALEEIAMFNERIASEHLLNTGSYEVFDEPRSVKVARAALEIVGGESSELERASNGMGLR